MVKDLPANAGDMGSIPDSGRSLEKEMATHSSILAWRIPWTEEPGELQSMGLQRVGHNSGTEYVHKAEGIGEEVIQGIKADSCAARAALGTQFYVNM